MIIKSLKLSDKNEVRKWDDFVQNQGQLYHDSRWADLLQSVYSFEPLYLYAEEDGAMVSALPLFFIKKPFGGNEIVSVPHSDAAGMINTESYSMYLDYLYEHFRADTVKIMQFKEPLGDLQANTSEVSIIKDLPTNAAGIINSVSDSRKRSYVRKSLKEPYELVIGNHSKLLSDFYELYLNKMRNFGTPPHPYRYFTAIRESFGDTCIIIAAKDSKGDLVGAMFCMGITTRMLNSMWFVVPAKHLKNLVGYFIEYHVMAYAIRNGYSAFNMGRCEKQGGNYDFKVGMGGKPVQLYRYRFKLESDGFRSVEVATSKEKFRSQAQVWAKLPSLITDNIGPLIRKWVY